MQTKVTMTTDLLYKTEEGSEIVMPSSTGQRRWTHSKQVNKLALKGVVPKIWAEGELHLYSSKEYAGREDGRHGTACLSRVA